MEKLHLALLAKWAEEAGLGGIKGRKRLQKVVYFLSQAGCRLDVDYHLHHYGPYSREVANLTDVMVSEGLLSETGGGGSQYEYCLAPHASALIDDIRRACPEDLRPLDKFAPFAKKLFAEELWLLELGSTILYFYRLQPGIRNWESALSSACLFKKVDAGSASSRRALDLAQKFSVLES